MSIIPIAKSYAINCHKQTNHLYDGQPYEIHLEMVVKYLLQFKHLVSPQNLDNLIAAAWCHDVIEDCRETYNDVLKVTNKGVAELVYALTNEKGRNREERANDKYYQGIRDYEDAGLLKICDRLANLEYSISKGSSMADKYKKENEKFEKSIYDKKYVDAIVFLNDMASGRL